VVTGQPILPRGDKLTFTELAAAYLEDYEKHDRASVDTARGRVANLTEFFGRDMALAITSARIGAYQLRRKQAQASPSTINREVAALGRMFALALKAGKIARRPELPERLPEPPPRQGFFEHAEYLSIRKHLPPAYQDVLDFGYLSGWRRTEITGLTWAEVDLSGDNIRLDPARSKTKTGRLLPISSQLRGVLGRRLAARRLGQDLVFHVNGRPIGDWRKSWARACKAARLPGKLFHDLRRTVARNLIRQGTPETVAMKLTGHKTRSVFQRYDIVSEADLRQASSRLGELAAQ
jgi:integrase